MTRIYENPGFAKRNNISVIVLVAVVIYGFFELYTAFGTGSQDQMAAMFGVLFVGGGIYGGYTIWNEARDAVTAIDADFDTGRAAVTLWRPFKSMVIDVPIDRLTGWRHWVKVGKRNMRTHFVDLQRRGLPEPALRRADQGRDAGGLPQARAGSGRAVRGEHRQAGGGRG